MNPTRPTSRPRARFGLRVRFRNHTEWSETACRFDPDTREKADEYGRKGVDDGMLDAYEVTEKNGRKP